MARHTVQIDTTEDQEVAIPSLQAAYSLDPALTSTQVVQYLAGQAVQDQLDRYARDAEVEVLAESIRLATPEQRAALRELLGLQAAGPRR
jgi:hypothetical protein